MPTFKSRVIDVVKKIPRGRTMSYAQVARLAGNPRAARAVGAIMRANRDPEVPCHRVIRSDGSAGGFNRGREKKIALLKSEGANLKDEV